VAELGYFSFGGTGIGVDNTRNVSDETKWLVGARDGVYDAALFYDFGPSERNPDRYVYTNVRSHSLSCDLSGNVVEVTFEPRFLKNDITATLTARIDGILVLDALRLDNSDRNGSEIAGFNFTAGDDYFVLDGSAVADPERWPYQPQYRVSKRFPFRGGNFVPFGGRDFDVLHPLMVEATRERVREPPATGDIVFHSIKCIPELGEFSVGTITLHGEAASRSVGRATEVAIRYGIIDTRMLRAGHKETIRCDLGREVFEGILEAPPPVR
jgi:hypothetical protein